MLAVKTIFDLGMGLPIPGTGGGGTVRVGRRDRGGDAKELLKLLLAQDQAEAARQQAEQQAMLQELALRLQDQQAKDRLAADKETLATKLGFEEKILDKKLQAQSDAARAEFTQQLWIEALKHLPEFIQGEATPEGRAAFEALGLLDPQKKKELEQVAAQQVVSHPGEFDGFFSKIGRFFGLSDPLSQTIARTLTGIFGAGEEAADKHIPPPTAEGLPPAELIQRAREAAELAQGKAQLPPTPKADPVQQALIESVLQGDRGRTILFSPEPPSGRTPLDFLFQPTKKKKKKGKK